MHEGTARGWDVVAEAKYRAEIDEHLELLRAGGHNLLEPELRTVGDLIPGACVVHLQCSHGLDVLGFLNLGAASVVGVDISSRMIEQAREKAEMFRPGRSRFVRADVLEVPRDLDGTADLVYTGRGSLPWIMELPAWAASVQRVLAPGGHLYLLEGHPLDALWDRESPTLRLRPGVGYFDAGAEEAPGFPASVVERTLGADRPPMLERRWRPGQVIEALLGVRLELLSFEELPDLYWDQFPAWPEALERRLPHSYAILARKPAANAT